MVTVVQLVRASDCGSECRGFESHQSPSSNPLQLCVVRDFFVYLPSPPPLSAFRPCARSKCDKAPATAHSRHATSLVPRPCCRYSASRTVCSHPASAARRHVRSHPYPNARGSRKRFAPLHRRMRSGANRLLEWGSDAPVPMRFSKRLSGVVETSISSRAGARGRVRCFPFFAFTLLLLV